MEVAKGFGACMADDMGLGKTIQVISLLLKMKEEKKLKKPVLVICPTNNFDDVLTAIKTHTPIFFSDFKVDLHCIHPFLLCLLQQTFPLRLIIDQPCQEYHSVD